MNTNKNHGTENINPTSNEQKIPKLPERYLKEGFTPFVFSMTFIAHSIFSDAFSMLIAKEDVTRDLQRATEIALKLLSNKINKLYPEDPPAELEYEVFYTCCMEKSSEDSKKYFEAVVALREDIRKGKYSKEAKKIFQITEYCMKKIFKAITEVKNILTNHISDLPTNVVAYWSEELHILMCECINLNTLVNPKYDYTMYMSQEPYPEIIPILEDVYKASSQIKCGIDISWDIVCNKGKILYPDSADDIDNAVYESDENLKHMLVKLFPTIREDVKNNNIPPYDPTLFSNAVREQITLLLDCYVRIPTIITKYINGIHPNEILDIYNDVNKNLVSAFRLLDMFDVKRNVENSKSMTAILTFDFSNIDPASLKF